MKVKTGLIALMTLLMFASPALAQDDSGQDVANLDTEDTPGLEAAWSVIQQVIRLIQFGVGAAALYYGGNAGFTLVQAGENPAKAQEAKKTLVFAVGGIVLAIAAPFLLENYIVEPYLLNPGG